MIKEVIEIDGKESAKTVKELRKELNLLKDKLIETEQGTEEYNKVLVEAANRQHKLREMMQEVNANAMDTGQKIANVSRVVTGFGGAITAVTSTLSLFGIENEEVAKKMHNVNTALLAVVEGMGKIDSAAHAWQRLVRVVDGGTKSMKLFKIALASTGIGLLAVVIGGIVANWEEFASVIGLSSEKLEHFGDIAKGVFNVFAASLRGIALALANMVKGNFQEAWDSLKDGFNVVDNFNQGVANSIAAREEAETKKAQEEADKRAKIAEEEAKKRMAAAAKLAKYEKDLAESKLRGDDADKYSEKSIKIQEQYFKRMFSIYKKDSDEYKALVLEKEQWLQDWENHILSEAEKENKANLDKIEKERQARQNILSNFDNELLTERERLDARYNLLIDAAEKEGQETSRIHQWYEAEKTRITKEEEERQTQIKQDEADKQKQIQVAQIQALSSMSNGIADILGTIADNMEEGSEQQKGLAIAGATIQMLGGIAAALAMTYTTHTGWWDWVLGATQAATIAASGAAQIAKIKNVKTDGSNSNVSAAMPSINLGAVMGSTPDFTQTLDGASTQAAIKDQRVYVTEHDITETQNKVRVAENNAKY